LRGRQPFAVVGPRYWLVVVLALSEGKHREQNEVAEVGYEAATEGEEREAEAEPRNGGRSGTKGRAGRRREGRGAERALLEAPLSLSSDPSAAFDSTALASNVRLHGRLVSDLR